MYELHIPKLSWPLYVALAGAVFSIFALIHNPHFIYYGFLTFLCGILCQFIDATYNFWLKKKCWKPLVVILQALLVLVWIFSLYREIYK